MKEVLAHALARFLRLLARLREAREAAAAAERAAQELRELRDKDQAPITVRPTRSMPQSPHAREALTS